MKKLLFALLAATIIGCTPQNKNLFKMVEYDCQLKDKDLCLYFEFCGNIDMPTKEFGKSHKLLQDSIVAAIFGSEFANYSTKKALRVYADSSFVEYKKIYDEIYENNPIEPTDTFHFETNIKGCVAYHDAEIVSYQRMLYTYSGGAHGMTTKTNYVFDIKTGKLLTEEDIFGKGFERSVKKLLTEKANVLRAEDKLPAEDEFYNNWNIVPNGNFTLTDSSVIYTFNPYEIAPYCYGVIDIEIKRNEELGMKN